MHHRLSRQTVTELPHKTHCCEWAFKYRAPIWLQQHVKDNQECIALWDFRMNGSSNWSQSTTARMMPSIENGALLPKISLNSHRDADNLTNKNPDFLHLPLVRSFLQICPDFASWIYYKLSYFCIIASLDDKHVICFLLLSWQYAMSGRLSLSLFYIAELPPLWNIDDSWQ